MPANPRRRDHGASPANEAALAATEGDGTRSERTRTRSATPSGGGTGSAEQPDPRRHRKWHPRQWALWRRPKRFVAYLVVMETVALATLAYAFATMLTTPKIRDWVGL